MERSKYYNRMKGLTNIKHVADLLHLVVVGKMPCCLWDSGGLVCSIRVARPNWLPCTITVLFNCSTSEMKFKSIRDFL